MRKAFLFILLLFVVQLVAQDYSDSVQNKFWYSSIHHNAAFHPGTMQVQKGSFRNNDHLISKNYILYKPWRSQDVDSLRYTYHGDSLILYPQIRRPYYEFIDCPNLYYEDHELQEEWVFYSERHLKSLPLDFKTLRLSHWNKGSLEINYDGEVLYDGRGLEVEDLYGHHRYQLNETELRRFHQLLKEESLRLKRLSCQLHSLLYSHKKTPCITYETHEQSHFIREETSNLNELGFKNFSFLDSTISLDKLEFQNFVDGDSAEGVVHYSLSAGNVDLFKTKLNFLGSYEDQDQTLYLYTGLITPKYSSSDKAFEFYQNKKFYLEAEEELDTTCSMLIETLDISSLRFELGRAFHKPDELIFRRLLKHQLIPPNHKLVLDLSERRFSIITNSSYKYQQTNAFVKRDPKKNHYTLWGIPYPFLRPDFQVAFEKYVLPDWEAYHDKMQN
jgi:hypothetical protein